MPARSSNRRSPGPSSGRISFVWLVPVLALGLGAWTVIEGLRRAGPTVRLELMAAAGIKEGETSVRCLDVEVGHVTAVELDAESSVVTATIQMEPGVESLLREDTRFWVVTPRVGLQGISGLSTLLSGSYLNLEQGTGAVGRRSYTVLERPPATPSHAPGVHLELTGSRSSSVSVGSPVLYHGHEVGSVEHSDLDVDAGTTTYRIFVAEPYDRLVTTASRFWDASGVNFNAGGDGLNVHMESLATILAGGVAFESSPDMAGQPVDDDHSFHVHPDRRTAFEETFEHGVEFLALFGTSVRGLLPDAPVEYRGIRVGTVVDVALDIVPRGSANDDNGQPLVPVLIRIEPARAFGSDTAEEEQECCNFMMAAIDKGLRATLGQQSLITGQLLVQLDFLEEGAPEGPAEIEGFRTMPTAESGFGRIEHQISALLEEVRALPVESLLEQLGDTTSSVTQTANAARETLMALQDTVGEVHGLLADPKTQSIPADTVAVLERLESAAAGLDRLMADPTLRELPGEADRTLEGLQAVAAGLAPGSPTHNQLADVLRRARNVMGLAERLVRQLEQRPSSLIFSSRSGADTIPGKSK